MYTKYQESLISIILKKDFNPKKVQGVLDEFLNTCSSSIFAIQSINKTELKTSYIYNYLKNEHEKVFKKISYDTFYRWYRNFQKKNSDIDYLKSKQKYFKCIESLASNSFSDNSVSSNFGNIQNLTEQSSVRENRIVTAPLVNENHSISLNNNVVASHTLENRVVVNQVSTTPIVQTKSNNDVIEHSKRNNVQNMDFGEPPKINLFETKKETTWDILSNQGVPKASLPLTLLSPDDPRYPFSGKCDSVYYDAKGILYDGNSNISLGLNESYPIPINTDIPYDKGKDGYYWYTYSYVDEFNQKNSKNFFPKDFVTFLKTDFMSFSLQYGEKAFISISLT